MPLKANADRRHHIPRQPHWVTNSATYDAALRQRGSLTVWFTDTAIAARKAEPRATRGGQPRYSGLAIATALTLRAVFRLALRQTERLIGSVITLLGLTLAVPDAMGCQTAIAEKILARGGDYLLTLKGNHKLAHAVVVEHFEQHCFRQGAPGRPDCDAFDDTHGRLVRRRVFASTEAASLEALSSWPGLRSVLVVESIRSVNTASGKVETEIR